MDKGTKCSNCGQLLSKRNIRFAREEAGLPDEALLFFYPPYIRAAIAALSTDELEFYCPRYDSDSETCVVYSRADERVAARWRTTGEQLT